MDLKIVALVLLLSLLLFIPTPQIDSVTPNFGLNNQVVHVVIDGDKFGNKVTIQLARPGEPDIIATDVKRVSQKQVECSFDLRGQAIGKWNVVVTNRKKAKATVLVEGFEIQYPAPTVTKFEPNQGLAWDTVIVNLTGAGFRAGAKLQLKSGEQTIEAAGLEVVSDTQISAVIDLVDTVPGSYDVIVINDDGKPGVLKAGFTIEYPEPTVTQFEPVQGLTWDTVIVDLTGTGFRAGAKLQLKSVEQTIEATDLEVVSDTQISAVIDLADTVPGSYDVIVTNDDGKSGILEAGFEIAYPEPTVSEVDPGQGITSETVTVNLTGSGFRPGASIELMTGDQTIAATDVEVVSDTLISAEFDLADTAPGTYDVIVTNSDEQTGTLDGGFEVQYPEPTLSEIDPGQGVTSETVTVNLTGTGFRPGATVELGTEDQVVAATDVEVVSDTQISAVFDLADVVPGNYDVIVTNDDGKSASWDGGFEIQYPEPFVTQIDPSQGLTWDTVIVNITGTDFRPGATAQLKAGEQIIEATDVETVSDTQISAVFDLVDTVPGSYDVIVTNDDGKSGILEAGFEIQYPEPTIFEISPNQGLSGDTVIINLNGTGFRPGVKLELKAGEQIIEATDVETVSDTQISAVFDLADVVPGNYDVIVTNDDGKSGTLDGGFEIQYSEPFVTDIEPTQGSNNETVTISVNGAGFRAGAEVQLCEGEQVIEATAVEIVSDTQISAEFDLNDSVPGNYDVMVTNDDGKTGSLTGGFEITENQAGDSTVEEETPDSTDDAAAEDEVTPDCQKLNEGLKPIFFGYNQFVIPSDQMPGLEENVKILTENPNLFILLGGNADERGSQKYNLGLSENRAEVIKQFLIDHEIDPARISVYAYGEDYPVKKGHNEPSWSFNRRVDISVWESPPTREQGLEITVYSNEENN